MFVVPIVLAKDVVNDELILRKCTIFLVLCDIAVQKWIVVRETVRSSCRLRSLPI